MLKLSSFILISSCLTGCGTFGIGTKEESPPAESKEGPAPLTEEDAGMDADASTVPSPSIIPGADGKDGADTKIHKTWKCDFTVSRFAQNTIRATNCSDTVVSVNGFYYAAEESSGDVFVRVGVDSSGSGSSSSYLWASGSWEADNAANWLLRDVCTSGLTPDAATTGNWNFVLDKATGIMTTKYVDSDVQGGEVVVKSICAVKDY